MEPQTGRYDAAFVETEWAVDRQRRVERGMD